jgi:hypothetical protein
MKKSTKIGVGMTECSYWSKYLPNGGVQWLLVKPWTSSIGRCVWYCTGAPPRPSKMASKVGAFFLCCCVSCRAGGRWGNTEQVVAWWWCLEAYGVALDMWHLAIQAALHPPICIAIEMACNGGAFDCYHQIFAWHYS